MRREANDEVGVLISWCKLIIDYNLRLMGPIINHHQLILKSKKNNNNNEVLSWLWAGLTDVNNVLCKVYQKIGCILSILGV